MLTEYKNSQGKITVIATMHDAHLWSAYKKYQERLNKLNFALKDNKVTVDATLLKNRRKLEELVYSLKTELEKRDLM